MGPLITSYRVVLFESVADAVTALTACDCCSSLLNMLQQCVSLLTDRVAYCFISFLCYELVCLRVDVHMPHARN